jgi:hypothetical protein
MSNLFPFAARLAAAIQRRQYLDDLACDGQGVPAQVTRANEEEIRAAEVKLIRVIAPPDKNLLEPMDHRGLIGSTMVVQSSLTTRTRAKNQTSSGRK